MGAPPGGPERTTPPVLVSVSPESGATNVRARGVVFEFDVVVNDRDIARYFLLSPRDGAPRVSWHRERVEVRPRRAFRPNTAYSVTMLPGLTDLRSNATLEGKSIVFSTGPTIPPFMVAGRTMDWVEERVTPNALVEVIRVVDSLPYVGAADSAGQFSVGPLDAGAYLVRALRDNNNNRAIDVGEPWDTVSVQVRDSTPFVELLLAVRDTIPPRLLTVAARDSVTIRASFDRPVQWDTPLDASSFRVVKADSTPLRIVAVQSAKVADSIAQAARARQDSISRRDSTGRDTTARDTSAARRRASITDLPTLPPARRVEVRPSRPAPVRDVVIRLDSLTPLQPGATYRVTALNVRGLLGPVRTSERLLNVVRQDTTARRDAPTRRPP
jgi:hypothetical protein